MCLLAAVTCAPRCYVSVASIFSDCDALQKNLCFIISIPLLLLVKPPIPLLFPSLPKTSMNCSGSNFEILVRFSRPHKLHVGLR